MQLAKRSGYPYPRESLHEHLTMRIPHRDIIPSDYRQSGSRTPDPQPVCHPRHHQQKSVHDGYHLPTGHSPPNPATGARLAQVGPPPGVFRIQSICRVGYSAITSGTAQSREAAAATEAVVR